MNIKKKKKICHLKGTEGWMSTRDGTRRLGGEQRACTGRLLAAPPELPQWFLEGTYGNLFFYFGWV